MHIRRLSLLFLALFIIALLPSDSSADRRKYVWTYQAVTMPANASELEFYQTTRMAATNSWEYRVEIEHGITDRWDVSIYQIYAQAENQSLRWDAAQFRTRYKLAAPGTYFMDPLLYLEYNRKTDLKKQNKLEGKLILSRDFDKVNFALNPVYEFFFAPGEPVHKAGLDAALSYEFNYSFSLGIESNTRHEFVKLVRDITASYLGPTFSLATSTAYFSFGYEWGMTEKSDDARARFLMGIHL